MKHMKHMKKSTGLKGAVTSPAVVTPFLPTIITLFLPAVVTPFLPTIITPFLPTIITPFLPAILTRFLPAVVARFLPAVVVCLAGFAFAGDVAASLPRTNSITPVAGHMPEWWRGPDTATAGDGIPDEWRRRTHTRGVSWDADLTGKGQNLLQDFWSMCNPRRFSTLNSFGLQISDAALIASGKDPLKPLTFVPDEPMKNGFILIWTDASGNIPSQWFYGFQNNSAGFDRRRFRHKIRLDNATRVIG
jgi:hypothetical protein